MITDRNKLNFVTIQWLWFLCLIAASLHGSNTWTHFAEATQHHQQQQQQLEQQQQQQQQQQEQLKSTLQLQSEVKSNGLQQQNQQDVTVRNFSPRMDYNNNEWRPVGRGDPLKNDPTFDYSPPTLDRVKYWADPEKDKEKPEEALIDAKLKKANPGKNEILLLGVTGDRMRGVSPFQQHSPNMVKNAKGETPLLQPKYTSIRRSYYAHQLPTHLMPPPMQPIVPASQQHMTSASNTQQSQHQQPHHLQQAQAMHIVKPVHTEYRHNMPAHSYMNSSPMNSMTVHSSPHYMSTATQPWMHASGSPSMGASAVSFSHSPSMMPNNSHRYSHPHSHAIDSRHQESVHYLSYQNHPSLTSTPSIMLGMNGGMAHHEIYSPNSIRGSSNGHKLSSTSSRKPWIHDLLKKEFIKPIKPTKNSNSHNVDTVKSSYLEPQHFEPIARPQGISTTYAPVTFVTPTTSSTTTTTQTIHTASTTQNQATSTTLSPMYIPTSPTYTTHAPRTTTTLSPTRLLIPNTSNLSYRPTVAPLKMTTDSLFSHYNQPEQPLRGPMYLIIEGHSKVKTYGKDELDPHKPKIVPIIPKREPVVRVADPNEKRGTPETYQVKHLHSKPFEATKIPIKPTTTKPLTSATGSTTKKPTQMIKTPSKITTTVKPQATVKNSTTTKPTPKKLMTSTTTSTITTVKPATTKATKPQLVKTSSKGIKNPSKNDKSTVNELKMLPKNSSPNALDSTSIKPSHQVIVNEPPTGMQGLLSFLDSSLDTIFKEEPIVDHHTQKVEKDVEFKDTATKLMPVPMQSVNQQQQQQQQQYEARVSTKLEPVKAEDYDDYENDNYFKMTTEYLPRETRQVFDYDQLPESRISLKDNANLGSFLEDIDDEEDLSTFNMGDEYEEDDDEVDDISALINDDLADMEEENLTNTAQDQRQQNDVKKA